MSPPPGLVIEGTERAVPLMRRDLVRWFDDRAIRGRWPAAVRAIADTLRTLAACDDTAPMLAEPGILDHPTLRTSALDEAWAHLGDEAPALLGPRTYAAVHLHGPTGQLHRSVCGEPPVLLGARVEPFEMDGFGTEPDNRREAIFAQVRGILAPWHPTGGWQSTDGGRTWRTWAVPS